MSDSLSIRLLLAHMTLDEAIDSFAFSEDRRLRARTRRRTDAQRERRYRIARRAPTSRAASSYGAACSRTGTTPACRAETIRSRIATDHSKVATSQRRMFRDRRYVADSWQSMILPCARATARRRVANSTESPALRIGAYQITNAARMGQASLVIRARTVHRVASAIRDSSA